MGKAIISKKLQKVKLFHHTVETKPWNAHWSLPSSIADCQQFLLPLIACEDMLLSCLCIQTQVANRGLTNERTWEHVAKMERKENSRARQLCCRVKYDRNIFSLTCKTLFLFRAPVNYLKYPRCNLIWECAAKLDKASNSVWQFWT